MSMMMKKMSMRKKLTDGYMTFPSLLVFLSVKSAKKLYLRESNESNKPMERTLGHHTLMWRSRNWCIS